MKALIITGNLVQDHEFIYPYYRLKEEGFDVTVALKDGFATTGSLGTKIPCDTVCRIIPYDLLISEINEYDLLVIPGGAKCMEYLRQNTIVLNFITAYHSGGGIIASICHGAQMLISARLVKNKRISGYYSIKDDIENAGAEYIDAQFVSFDRIVSCPHYKYLGAWMKETLRVVRENAKL